MRVSEVFIPNKPAKYGLKLVMLCDVESKFKLNAIPYLGKSGNLTQKEKALGLGHHCTKELTKNYHNSGRNVTTDNWFTSMQSIR